MSDSNPPPSRRLLQRLQSWRDRSIVNRASFASAIFGLTLMCFIGVAALPVIYLQVREAITVDHEYQLKRVTEFYEHRMDATLESMQTLARNSLVVNAFVDSVGRDAYLLPLVRDYRLPFGGSATLVVLDLNLEPISGNIHTGLAKYARSVLGGRALSADQPLAALSQDGQSIQFAVAVHFPPAASNVGVIILDLPVEAFFRMPTWQQHPDHCHIVTAGGRTLHRADCRTDAADTGLDPQVLGRNLIGDPIEIRLLDYGNPVARPLGKVMLTYMLLALAAGLFAWFIARRRVGVLAQPLVDLSRTAQEIAKAPESLAVAPVVGTDEVGMLATSFNTMLFQLRRLQVCLEDRVRDKTKELAESEERFRAMANAAPVLIWMADVEGRCIWLNQGWLDFTGLDIDHALGRGWLDVMHRDDRERCLAAFAAHFARQESFRLEFRVRHKDGAYRWVLDSATPRRDAMGQFLGYIGSGIDITERHQAEQELIAARDAAARLARTKSEFLANMSHEIRTPMNGIIGLTQLALTNAESPRMRDYLTKIRASSESLLGILNDILDYSKFEAGRMTIDSRPFDLEALLRNLRNLFSARAEEKALQFRIDLAPDVPLRLVGDSLRIQQTLANLVGNAIKFTDRGSVMVSITRLDTSDDEARVRFRVTDTGIGMAPDVVENLFKPFVQADSTITRRFGGTGLGLAISRNILRALGSDFRVESTAGAGSSFSFDLRMQIAAEAESAYADGAQANPSFRQHPSALAGRRILVVEDNAVNQQVVGEFLRLSGASVEVAENGEEALAVLATRVFDAVLMDVRMPVLDGIQATRRLRSGLHLDALPVIALTAGVTSEERDEALAAGMTDFLPKPIDPDALVAVLMRHMEAGSAPVSSVQPEREAGGLAVQGFDVPRLRDLLGTDEAVADLLLQFAESGRQTMVEFEERLAQGDLPAAEFSLHNLKGAAGNIGADDLYAAAMGLDAELKAGRCPERLLAELRTAWSNALAALAPLAARAGSDSAAAPENAGMLPGLVAQLERLLSQNDLIPDDLMAAIETAAPAERRSVFRLVRRHIDAIDYPKARDELKRLTV